jgi:CRP/FNR family cyclic AMP-dependent transcriptional regulator
MAGSENISFDISAFNAKHGGVTTFQYGKNQLVYAQGNSVGAIFYIAKGKIQLTVVSEEGKERVVAILKAGDFCGEGCLNDELLRVSTATTMTESVVARLEKQAVTNALHEDLSFSEYFVSYLLGRNMRLMEDLIDQLFNSSEQRLARALLLLANYEKKEPHDSPLVNINQQILAKMIGTTRSRINYFMNKFRRLGFIEYNGGIKVHPSLLNVVLRDHSQIGLK